MRGQIDEEEAIKKEAFARTSAWEFLQPCPKALRCTIAFGAHIDLITALQ
jgi:hypothetical protein